MKIKTFFATFLVILFFPIIVLIDCIILIINKIKASNNDKAKFKGDEDGER